MEELNYRRIGRPIKYKTEEDKKKARQIAKRKWNNEHGKEYMADYNKKYYESKKGQLDRIEKKLDKLYKELKRSEKRSEKRKSRRGSSRRHSIRR